MVRAGHPHRPSARRLWLKIAGVTVGVLVLLAIIGNIVGPQGKPAPAAAKASQTTASASSSATSTTTASPVPTTSSPAPPPAPPASTTVPAPAPAPAFNAATADRAMCQVTVDVGTYWLHVSSAIQHNYTVCGGFPLQADNLDTIFASGPNVDRRCLSGNDFATSDGALVGVYSSSSSADLAAAKQFCAEAGWSND